MLRVGLTGGLATGKSYVGEALRTLGCHLLKADELGHRLLRRGEECYAPVIALFGDGILDANGEIDRARLGAIVFAEPLQLEKLNAIVHPAVFRREREWMDAIAKEDPSAITVVEAAILIETGNYKSFDKIVVTWCPKAQQIERALARSASIEDVQRRLARQMPADEKRRYADFIIDTSGSLDETDAQVHRLYEKLVTLEREGLHP
jgi:dephospho-CoA kinase